MVARINIPLFSCDCHTHVVGPRSKYSLLKNLIYLPQEATPLSIKKFLYNAKLKRVVLVQPSFYGTNNSCLEHALLELGSIARGIVVVDNQITNEHIDKMHRLGVRGIRINSSTFIDNNISETKEQIKAAVKIAERNGWHIQFFLKPKMISELKNIINNLSADIVFDHCAFMTEATTNSKEFKFVTKILEKGKTWIKLSAPYRLSREGTFSIIKPLIKHFINVNPDRLVWGSDWPHTPIHNGKISNDPKELPYRKFNIPQRIEELSNLVNEATTFQKIMQDNPSRLYDF